MVLKTDMQVFQDLLFYLCQKFLPSESYTQLRIGILDQKQSLYQNSVQVFFFLNFYHFNFKNRTPDFLPPHARDWAFEMLYDDIPQWQENYPITGYSFSIAAYTCRQVCTYICVYTYICEYVYFYNRYMQPREGCKHTRMASATVGTFLRWKRQDTGYSTC